MRTIIGLAVGAGVILAVLMAVFGGSTLTGGAPTSSPVEKAIASADPASAVKTVPAPAPAGAAQPVATAKPAPQRPPLCMSDAELAAYARYAAYGPIAYGAASCKVRFPDLGAEVDKDVAAMSAQHGALIDDVGEAALQPFTRSFGPDGAKRRDARADSDNSSTFQRIRGYSRDECKSHIAALEGFGHMSGKDFDNVLDNLVRQTIDTRRSAMPGCG
jgi:hypothetical protein